LAKLALLIRDTSQNMGLSGRRMGCVGERSQLLEKKVDSDLDHSAQVPIEHLQQEARLYVQHPVVVTHTTKVTHQIARVEEKKYQILPQDDPHQLGSFQLPTTRGRHGRQSQLTLEHDNGKVFQCGLRNIPPDERPEAC
jgi:hypothetical protein